MCGIAGIHLKPTARMDWRTLERFADALLLGIDSRGGHATGFVARSESGEVRLQRAACEARPFIDERRPFPVGTRTVLLHTRFATQGDPAFPENNHPVYAGPVYCVHNGHISNDDALIREAGSVRLGRVDSEAIPAIVNHYGWDAAAGALEAVEGAAAVALLNADTGAVVLARGYQSPLVVVDSSAFVVWASTRQAIESAWRQTLGTAPNSDRFEFMREGELVRLAPDGSRQGERFTAHVPSYSFTYYQAPATKAPTTTVGRIPDTVRGWLGWDDDDDARQVPDDDAPGLASCGDCGDYFAEAELWEVLHGVRLCWACEDRYLHDDGRKGSGRLTAETVAAIRDAIGPDDADTVVVSIADRAPACPVPVKYLPAAAVKPAKRKRGKRSGR